MRTKRFQQVAWMALLGLIVGGLVWSTPALAQEKGQQKGACAEDEQKFCADVKGAKARTQCLKDHEAELSQGCKDLRAKATQRAKDAEKKQAQLEEACKGDATTLCKDVKPGRGALMQCLRSHEADLSAACKDILPKGKSKAS